MSYRIVGANALQRVDRANAHGVNLVTQHIYRGQYRAKKHCLLVSPYLD